MTKNYEQEPKDVSEELNLLPGSIVVLKPNSNGLMQAYRYLGIHESGQHMWSTFGDVENWELPATDELLASILATIPARSRA